MNIGVVGLGYVGLSTAAVLAELDHHVICMDNDREKIERLKRGEIPIYEPGLEEWVVRYSGEGRLTFTNRLDDALADCSVVFVTVGTPPKEDGSPDLSALQAVTEQLARQIRSYLLIVVKSTVPPGTCEWIEASIRKSGVDPACFDVASNPEFLREGTALEDMLHPDRIIIGAGSERAASLLKEVYAGIDTAFTVMSLAAAETTKYASNAFLAAKISFINELSRVCDALGVDVTEVASGMGQDTRIAPHFLRAGLGYGGSCFPKDVGALYHAASSHGIAMPLLQAVKKINDSQVDWCIAKLERALGFMKEQQQITVWGATFKPDTDDIRESRALLLMRKLTEAGYRVHAYDPLVRPNAPDVWWFNDRYDALIHSDVLILATEWGVFLDTDWHQVASRMKGRLLFDARNAIDRRAVEEAGLEYMGVGRS
ncbi:UDP-glucose dehydrogenase family protein [Paenibacillaceae bacterium WGS1546]|uniref:UDP-glucose dehydrogenase family protein n=1 Tax=Cohnella sp. WGS1546 TaxID=3366810 RepID=UPI00372D754B